MGVLPYPPRLERFWGILYNLNGIPESGLEMEKMGNGQEVVHFVYTLPERIACLPMERELHSTKHHQHYQRTSEPTAVTCQACRASPEFKTAVESMHTGHAMHGLQRK